MKLSYLIPRRQFHNYATRISPHLYDYPSFTTNELASVKQSSPAPATNDGITPLDAAIRTLIIDLRPYGLTKAEILLILNLGVGMKAATSAAPADNGQGGEGGDIDMGGETVEGGQEAKEGGEGEGEGEEEEEDGGDYGALALLDTVIEGREERLSDEDMAEILRIIRQSLRGSVVDV